MENKPFSRLSFLPRLFFTIADHAQGLRVLHAIDAVRAEQAGQRACPSLNAPGNRAVPGPAGISPGRGDDTRADTGENVQPGAGPAVGAGDHPPASALFGFLSPPGAGAAMGAVWWLALMRALQESTALPFVHLLDCGASPAHALLALSHGQRLAVLAGDDRQGIAARAAFAAEGGTLAAHSPPSFDLIAGVHATSSLVAYIRHGYCE
ncbi:hypothetical protein K2X14_07090 [Acetobacter sp. TBRC 12305]|nr:hypothetical protein [Acetobacter garciniae]MBX0344600.1 hypothetical protein [Acetobacter garciniae]